MHEAVCTVSKDVQAILLFVTTEDWLSFACILRKASCFFGKRDTMYLGCILLLGFLLHIYAHGMRNEISSSKESYKIIMDPASEQQSICVNSGKMVKKDLHQGQKHTCGDWLGSGKQIKAKGYSKGGWQSVKRDNQLGSVR